MSRLDSDTIEVIAETHIRQENIREQMADSVVNTSETEKHGGPPAPPATPDTEEFNFDNWAMFLSRNATKTLRKEELTTLQTLKLLTPADTAKLGLPMGQKILLDVGLTKLTGRPQKQPGALPARPQNQGSRSAQVDERTDGSHSEGDTSTRTTERPALQPVSSNNATIKDIRRQKEELMGAGNELDYLFSSIPPTNAPVASPLVTQASAVGHPSIVTHNPASPSASQLPYHAAAIDPRSILTTKATSRKAVHITAFLTESTKKRLRGRKRDSIVLARDQGEGQNRLMLQADESHPYGGILISEWASANCRVLNHLLSTGDLHRDHMEYYLAYTATIMDFASVYEWRNVLDFDFQYREQQAEHNFCWGYINPLLKMQVLSQPRNTGMGPRDSYQAMGRSRQSQGTNHNAIPDCKQWKANNGFCAFGDKCKFRHVPLQQQTRPPPATRPPVNDEFQNTPKNESSAPARRW